MRILLIGKDKNEAERVFAALRAGERQRFDLLLETDVEATRALLQEQAFDLILVDMHRGEDDISALAAVLNRSVGARVIVLVPLEHEGVGQRSLKLGAERYCIKEQLLHDLLLCVCEFAQRRPLAPVALSAVTDKQHQERQQLLFQEKGSEKKTSGSRPQQTHQESEPLRARHEDAFQQYVRRFGDALELALERMVYKVEFNISATLQHLADELGELQAQPRDLVEIYSTCLEGKRRRGNEQRYKGYAEEGRLLLIETMGYLVNYYRHYALAEDQAASGSRSGG